MLSASVVGCGLILRCIIQKGTIVLIGHYSDKISSSISRVDCKTVASQMVIFPNT